jgi:prevent-host-death family protein
MNVGTRELKNKLSHYLRRVREEGETVFVTDRGEVVAELRPVRLPDNKTERAALLAMTERGDLSPGAGRRRDFKPIKPRRRVSLAKIVLEDRR